MLKLIFKDIKVFSNIIISIMILMFLITTIAILFDNNSFMVILPSVIYIMIIPAFMLVKDERYSQLYITMPVSRFNYVISKYIIGSLVPLFVSTIVLSYTVLFEKLFKPGKFGMYNLITNGGFMIVLIPVILMICITYPLFFSFGMKKTTYISIVSMGVLGVLMLIGLVIIEKRVETQIETRSDLLPYIVEKIKIFVIQNQNWFTLSNFIIILSALLILSMFLSIVFFRKRDIGDSL